MLDKILMVGKFIKMGWSFLLLGAVTFVLIPKGGGGTKLSATLLDVIINVEDIPAYVKALTSEEASTLLIGLKKIAENKELLSSLRPEYQKKVVEMIKLLSKAALTLAKSLYKMM